MKKTTGNQKARDEATRRYGHRSMEDRAVAALQRTWHAIGYDAIEIIEPGEHADEEYVREMVSACGFATGHPATYGTDPEAVEWLEKLSHEEQDRVLAVAFPKGNYE
jgi:hypothetical protein